jgi:hypothetical protein
MKRASDREDLFALDDRRFGSFRPCDLQNAARGKCREVHLQHREVAFLIDSEDAGFDCPGRPKPYARIR